MQVKAERMGEDMDMKQMQEQTIKVTVACVATACMHGPVLCAARIASRTAHSRPYINPRTQCFAQSSASTCAMHVQRAYLLINQSMLHSLP